MCCRLRAYDTSVTGANVSFTDQSRLSGSSDVSDAEEDYNEPGLFANFDSKTSKQAIDMLSGQTDRQTNAR